MKKKIILLGCGNIGSRHLQAISNLPYELEIVVIDPNNDSIKLAKNRFNEAHKPYSNHTIVWQNEILDNVKNNDFVIIATNSKGRCELISNLLNYGSKRILVEKMVCQSSKEYSKLINLSKKHNSSIWINTIKRYHETFNVIKKYFNEKEDCNFSVLSGSAGLSCNAIHYMDLFAWIYGDTNVDLDGNYLMDKVFENKRGPDYVEFAGTLLGKFSERSNFSIHFAVYPSPTVITFMNKNVHIIVDENSEKIHTIKGPDELKQLVFKRQYVSGTSDIIIKEIFETNSTKLPTLEDHYKIHMELFDVFNKQYSKITGKKLEKCPIT